jgi:hypothetical protein
MSIHIDSCPGWDTIIVNTCSSVYELIVLRGDEGDVLVRGGSLFTEFRRVLFLGATADGRTLQPRTIEIGSHMQFLDGDRLVTTSRVQSCFRRSSCAASAEAAGVQ